LFFFYNILIRIYLAAIRITSVYNAKARLWISGRKDILREASIGIRKTPEKKKTVWFHCASLGEFEQGRSLLEAFHAANPEYRIILTFFSPSGYEIRKNYTGADVVLYMPGDTRRMARKFIDILSPDIVFFIKYEYWYNHLAELKRRNIPVYMISAIFRPSQEFFKWYGSWFRKQLNNLTWFFVQDSDSENLLKKIGINHVSVSGDTRFDRVSAVTSQAVSIPWMDQFCKDSFVIIAGSTWPADEEIILGLNRNNIGQCKFIIAPHEVDKNRIDELISRIGAGGLRYSGANEKSLPSASILVIDSIGMLAFLYRYVQVAYIGGGFGAGIHNILEAAAFGIPVIFGPNHEKFREARDLIRLGGAFPVKNETELKKIVDLMMSDPITREREGLVCLNYIGQHKGATQRILQHIMA
jgi:3-deoxy-D-manno-octulosonic-acid transferase